MKILIADDDRVSLFLLREILSSDRSQEITEASDGADAWTLLEQGMRPDLCILDIMMPRLDGLELLKRIREDQRLKNTNVILCTSLNDRTTVTQAAALSINYFILKPYTRRTVLAQVQKVKQSLGTPRRLESPPLVCERLDIDPPLYAKLLRTLIDEVPVAIGVVEYGIANGDLKTPVIKLNALRGAAANLAANRLITEIGRIETELITDAPRPTASDSEKAQQFQEWAALHQKFVVDGLAALKAELVFLISEADRFAKLAAQPGGAPQGYETDPGLRKVA